MELVAHDLVLDVPGQEDGQWQSNLHRAPVEKMELINENSLPAWDKVNVIATALNMRWQCLIR